MTYFKTYLKLQNHGGSYFRISPAPSRLNHKMKPSIHRLEESTTELYPDFIQLVNPADSSDCNKRKFAEVVGLELLLYRVKGRKILNKHYLFSANEQRIVAYCQQ